MPREDKVEKVSEPEIVDEEHVTTADEVVQLTDDSTISNPSESSTDRLTQLMINQSEAESESSRQSAESGSSRQMVERQMTERQSSDKQSSDKQSSDKQSVDKQSVDRQLSKDQIITMEPEVSMSPNYMGVPTYVGKPRDVSIKGGMFRDRHGILKNAYGIRIRPNGELLDPNDQMEMIRAAMGLG